MENVKNLLGNNKILISLIIVMLIVSGIQSVFLIKLYKSVEQDNTIVKMEENLDQHFEKQGDIFKHFDLDKQWDPFEEFQAMREQMERMFDNSNNRFKLSPFFDDNFRSIDIIPQTDIEEKDDRYIVTMNIPGSDETEINIDLEADTLTVSAKIKNSTPGNKGNGFLRMERNIGNFKRVLTLPGPVDEEKMETKYEDGVLMIVLPKTG